MATELAAAPNEAIVAMYMPVTDEELKYMQAASRIQPGIVLSPVTDAESVSAEGTVEDEAQLQARVKNDLKNGYTVVRVESSDSAVYANAWGESRDALAQSGMDHFLVEVRRQRVLDNRNLFARLFQLAGLEWEDRAIERRQY